MGMAGPQGVPGMRSGAARPLSWFEDRQIGLRDYLDVLQRRWRIVLGAFVAALAAAVVVSLLMSPIYRASATVTTDKTPPVVLLDRPGEVSFSGDQTAG